MRTFVIPGLLVSFLFCGCAVKKTAVIAKPAVAFLPAVGTETRSDNLSYDFGRIREGDVVEHSFLIQNEGKKVLNITGTVASCGCTFSSIRNNRLAPGEETFLDVKFDSKGFSGSVTQFVYVNTDDIDNTGRKFIIKAVVVPKNSEG